MLERELFLSTGTASTNAFASFVSFSIQLVVDASIPEELGGAGGEAVYVDTEGSFIIERVVDIAQATVEHCHLMAARVAGEKIM